MPENIFEALNEYSEAHSTPEPPLLKKINRETHVQVSQAHMLSGHLQGRFLSLMARLIRPASILEIGTFTGYSALCLAEGLAKGGVLHTIDNNDELTERCKGYFREAHMEGKIIQHTGEAATILPALRGPFDLVFLDADKPNYSLYFDLVIGKMPAGGILLADNVLYHGEVLLPESKRSSNARAISAFNEKISADDRVEQVLLTLRDGLFLIRKK
jgi:predicted O-methyltransferase YrrM